ELPAGYHLNPSAPQRFSVDVEQGGKSVASPLAAPPRNKNISLPIKLPILIPSTGAAAVTASFTFVYCREDNTGVCRIKTLQWRAPIEVVSDSSAPTEVRLSGKVAGD